jgi:aspartyl-tRNA(Asn)/glutamyl-tRNA(Gln) amidotransferase subunit C
VTVNDELIEKLEKLSSLKISDFKRDVVKKDLSEIIEFVENLAKVDANNINMVSKKETKLREDSSKSNSEFVAKSLTNTPKSEDNFFVVPNII